MIVSLPWPDKRLSPNARLHWSAKAKAVKASREAAKYLTWSAAGGARELRAAFSGNVPIPIKVTFCPPDNRRRDHDNLIASCKSAFDGIADALGVDDNRFRPSFDFAEPVKSGCIEFLITIPRFERRGDRNAESCLVNGDRPFSGGDQ